MDFNRFILERRGDWAQLKSLLDKVDEKGLESFAPEEAEQLFSLYRRVSSDLNLAQTRSANPAILEFLEGLVGRAWAIMAAPRMANPFKALWLILRHKFPMAVRSQARLFILSAGTFIAGALFAFAAGMIDEKTALAVIPPEHASIRPADRVRSLEKEERERQSGRVNAGGHAVFTAFLFTHNIKATGLVFALGLTFGVGTIIMLFYNGAMLGSLAALYLRDGVFLFFTAWIGPHGAIELPCVFLGATAGLMMAKAQYRRDLGPVWRQIRAMRDSIAHIFIGTASLLVVAGVIEGGFSQVNEPTIPYPFKTAVALALFIALMIYLFMIPARAAENAQRLGRPGEGS